MESFFGLVFCLWCDVELAGLFGGVMVSESCAGTLISTKPPAAFSLWWSLALLFLRPQSGARLDLLAILLSLTEGADN